MGEAAAECPECGTPIVDSEHCELARRSGRLTRLVLAELFLPVISIMLAIAAFTKITGIREDIRWFLALLGVANAVAVLAMIYARRHYLITKRFTASGMWTALVLALIILLDLTLIVIKVLWYVV